MTEPKTGWCIEEDKLRYHPRRMNPEGRRETLQGLIQGSLYSSHHVPADLLPMVFLPIALGGLAPPDELVEQLLGPKPPDEPERLPEAPVLDKSQLPSENPPEVPGILAYDEKMALEWRWAEVSDEDWAEHKAGIDEENARRQAAYTQEVAEYEARHPLLEKAKRDHQAAREAWEEEVARIEEGNATLKQRQQEYRDQQDSLSEGAYEEIGVFLGDMGQSSPAGINGHPMFFSVQIVHKEDWERIWKAWKAEHERLKNLDV